MSWFYLFIAGIMEVVWAIGIKYAEGFTKLYPSIGTIAGMIVSFYFLSLALRTIPIGTGYAVWTGIGAVGTAIYGILFFNEPREIPRLICILLIVSGIVGLRIFYKN